MGDYGGEILNEVKLNRPDKEMSTTPATLHNGNHHKVQECKVKVNLTSAVLPFLLISSSSEVANTTNILSRYFYWGNRARVNL